VDLDFGSTGTIDMFCLLALLLVVVPGQLSISHSIILIQKITEVALAERRRRIEENINVALALFTLHSFNSLLSLL